MKWLLKHEPVLVFGAVVAVGVFLVLHYGAVHALGIVQGLGTAVPVLVAGIARQFVTSPAGRQALTDAAGDVSRLPQIISDLEGVRNDVVSLKEQIGPLPKTGGLGGVAKWLADLARGHSDNLRAELQADVEAAKTDILDLIHQHQASQAVAQPSFDPPQTTTTVAPITVTYTPPPPLATTPEETAATPAETLTAPEPEPVSEATTPAPEADPVAELVKLLPSPADQPVPAPVATPDQPAQ